MTALKRWPDPWAGPPARALPAPCRHLARPAAAVAVLSGLPALQAALTRSVRRASIRPRPLGERYLALTAARDA